MKASDDPSDLLCSLADLKNIRDNFWKELTYATAGKKTSLPFIKHPLPLRPIVCENELFQTIVIGGTKFETALLKKKAHTPTIISYQQGTVPQFISLQIFFDFFCSHLASGVKTVALNFAWGLRPVLRNGVLDGIRHSKSAKEHAFSGLYEKTVGLELEKYIYKTQKRRITVSCANDTICLLLSGLNSSTWQSIIAGVVGSGLNFAYFFDHDTAVNLESSNFDKFKLSKTGYTIDQSSLNKHRAIFEKETSGAYLHKHFNMLIKNTDKPITSTEELSAIASAKNSRGELARFLLERSASLVACQMAGLYRFKNNKQLGFIIEGSLFWHGWHYRQFVKKYLTLLEVPTSGISFIKIKNSSLMGAARLVTGT